MLLFLFDYFEFEIEKPCWENPRPTFFVGIGMAVRQVTDNFVDQPWEENELSCPPSKVLRCIKRKIAFTGQVTEAGPAEEMLVRRIREGVHAGEVRHGYSDRCAVPADPVNFFHCADDVCTVLKDVISQYVGKLTIGKRPRFFIEIVNNARVNRDIAIQIDRTRYWFRPTAEIQGSLRQLCPPLGLEASAFCISFNDRFKDGSVSKVLQFCVCARFTI